MRFNPEGHFVNLVLEKVAMIDPHRLREISAAIFAIAALDIIEGTGLVLEQVVGGIRHADLDGFILTLGILRGFPARHMDSPRADRD